AWQRVRGPGLGLAMGQGPEGAALWFRAPLLEREAADRALAGLVAAWPRKVSPEPGALSVSARATVAERIGEVVALRVRAADTDATQPEGRADVLLRREGDELLGATGLQAGAALAALATVARDPSQARPGALAPLVS